MTTTISFRVSEQLEEFLKQEAEERMTTKSTVAQMLLAEKVKEMQAETGGSGPEKDEEEPVSTGLLGEPQKIQFPSKEAADGFRDEYSQFIDDERDDRRFTTVAVLGETPTQLVEEAANDAGKQAGSSGDGE